VSVYQVLSQLQWLAVICRQLFLVLYSIGRTMRKHSNFQTPLGNPSIQTHLVLVCCIKRLCIFGPKGTIQIYALLTLLLYDTEDDLLCFLFTIQNVRFVQIQTFQIIPTTSCQVFLGLYLGRSFSTGKVDPRGSRMMPLLQLWPLTSWPPKLTHFIPCSVDHLYRFDAQPVHSFSKHNVQ